MQADLLGRLEATPGAMDYQAYYDDDLNITWAANANINRFNTWTNQLSWVAGADHRGREWLAAAHYAEPGWNWAL